MESTKIKVCKVSELPSGSSKSITVNDKDVGVFNINGKYYAIDNLCLHAGGPLTDGYIDADACQVTCSWHGWAFDLATGKCVTHPRQDVFTGSYTIKTEGDEIFICL